MVECDSLNFGCNGGNLATAWKYLYNTGIVTDTCLPYTSGSGRSGACPNACSDKESWSSKYKCAEKAIKATNVAGVKSLIKEVGPVETGFTVYADFMNY
jgi:cathepsin B